MTDHDPDRDDVLKQLDAALNVEPSRAFADGVRARVRRSQVRTTQMWWGLAAAAGVGFAVMTLWRPAPQTPVQAPQQVNAAPVQVPAPVVSKTTPEPVAVAAPLVRVAANTTSEPRFEVITNQMAVLRQLWTDARGRRSVVADGEAVAEELSTKPIAIDPIEVRPIVVGEIGKEPGTGGANPIIRRANATKETK